MTQFTSNRESTKLEDILVVQLTGRMHYAAAIQLERGKRLAALLTDFRVPERLSLLANIWPSLENYCIDLPKNKIFGNPLVGIEYRARLRSQGHFRTETHLSASRRLSCQASKLDRSLSFGSVYSFDIQALETFREMKPRGKRLILEQCVAPRATQMEILSLLRNEYSDEIYQARKTQLEIFDKREREEWSLADKIICPSIYVKEQLIRFGVDAKKISLVPYGFGDNSVAPAGAKRKQSHDFIRAIFVGTAEPRKGLTTLLSAMDMVGENVHLDIYGDLSRIDKELLDRPNVTAFGKVPFRQLTNAYREADVCVLPSYLEGSATVVYEALSMGVPCIVTHETGSVITDGLDGFVIPSGQPSMLADCLLRILEAPEVLESMRRATLESAANFTFSRYGERLCAEI